MNNTKQKDQCNVWRTEYKTTFPIKLEPFWALSYDFLAHVSKPLLYGHLLEHQIVTKKCSWT